jgi:hypothetical protein
MSKMSTADKLLAGGSILLLIFSFFPWQSVSIFTANMWSGSGAFAGVIAGLLAIALVVVAVLSMTGTMANVNMGSMSADKLVGFLGLGVFAFGILKFLIVLFNEVGWAAFIGLVLLLAIGWGAWQKIQETGGFSMGTTTGGTTMGGTTTMRDTAPPPSAPPPSSAPPTTPPPAAPPPGGEMPPGDSTDY